MLVRNILQPTSRRLAINNVLPMTISNFKHNNRLIQRFYPRSSRRLIQHQSLRNTIIDESLIQSQNHKKSTTWKKLGYGYAALNLSSWGILGLVILWADSYPRPYEEEFWESPDSKSKD